MWYGGLISRTTARVICPFALAPFADQWVDISTTDFSGAEGSAPRTPLTPQRIQSNRVTRTKLFLFSRYLQTRSNKSCQLSFAHMSIQILPHKSFSTCFASCS